MPADGVYAGRVVRLDEWGRTVEGAPLGDAAISVGTNPTFDVRKPARRGLRPGLLRRPLRRRDRHRVRAAAARHGALRSRRGPRAADGRRRRAHPICAGRAGRPTSLAPSAGRRTHDEQDRRGRDTTVTSLRRRIGRRVRARIGEQAWELLRDPRARRAGPAAPRPDEPDRARPGIRHRQVGPAPLHPALRTAPGPAAAAAVHDARDRHRGLPPAPRHGGASLRMWKAFFPQAQILGLDIADKSFVNAAAHPHLPRQPGRPRGPGPDPRRRRRAAGHHRRRQPPARAHPRDLRLPVPPAGAGRHLRDRGHPDVLLAAVGRQQRPARPVHDDGAGEGPARRSAPRGVPAPRPHATSRPTPTCTSRRCTSTTIS